MTVKKTPAVSRAKLRNRFVAIDFETANNDRSSACALSLVVVDKKKIVEKQDFLIKPPSNFFLFSYLHGIEWEHVKNKPSFGAIWKEVRSCFEGVDFVAAHNAPFDRSVLSSCCRESGINLPGLPFLCTVRLSRSVWNIFPTKLPNVCKKLDIPLRHHDAGSDAHACAQIVIRALGEKKDLSNFILPERIVAR